ncbi:chemotaxis-specific protein-glutamate methyltransferase CheB [Reichenbachiella versicolor]|uniref:chemotaxis-specific protein-glutamate methyltransferase CheB n=1 Tax=Reichenbachiella versicolor TaxID=1821036 RepID=UPI0013A595A1|nr:chemotaxis-specific protein-glutamate methyltransferase CheB [Reichenbachiella versicolor]
MQKIKVLIADDSGFMRLLISDILAESQVIEVVGTAVDGKDAVEQVKKTKPDVLLLDMNMGDYSGLYAVERIMEECPLPILILSALGNTDLQPIFEALDLGAVDYLNKPQRGSSKLRLIEQELLHKIQSVSRANFEVSSTIDTRINTNTHTFSAEKNYDMIVIGASTGGPSAIEKVINSLPGNLVVPVIIVQHMPSNFIGSFVKRLDGMTPLKVMEGRANVKPKAGQVIVAPGNTNMILEKTSLGDVKIGFTDEVYREYDKPSINALMLSAAEVVGGRTIGVILTGMGKDGMLGMKAIRDKGGYTIAQSQKTCVIYGMPKAAVAFEAVERSIDIDEIGGFLVNSL